MKKGWRYVKIGDVCKLHTGGTPSKSKPEYFDGGEIKWLVSGDVHQKEIVDCDGRITQLGLDNSNARYLPQNSLIIALNGQGKTRGTVAILRTKATCNQSLVAISPNDLTLLSIEFLFYNLHGRYDEIRKITGDAGNERRGLNMPIIRNIEIPLPPLEEQQRIVAILDEAFEGLDRARANAEANLQNARELFESIQASLLTKNSGNWDTKNIADCFRLKSGDGLTAKQMVQGPFPVYGGNGIAGMHNQCNLNGRSVIIGRVGALCGNARFIDQPIWLTDNAFRVVDFQKHFDGKFLAYLLNFKNLRSLARQAAQPVISNSSLAGLELDFPRDVVEQEEIASKIEAAESEVDRLSQNYNTKLRDLADLRQSLLQKAFAGELT